MATYYISLTGDDSTLDGTNPLTPYETLNAAEAASSNGDTIEFADGTYPVSSWQCNGVTGYANIDKALILKATNAGKVNVSASNAIYFLRLNGAWAGDTLGVDGINFTDASGSPTYAIAIKNQSATVGTLNITNCDFQVNGLYGVFYTGDTVSGMDLSISNCTHTGGSTSRAFVYLNTYPSGTFNISDCTLTQTGVTVPQGVIKVQGTAAGVTCSVKRVIVNIDTNGATGRGIYITNIDNAIVDGCTVTSSSSASDAGFSINITSESATLSSDFSQVINNTVLNKCYAGFGIVIGTDGSTAGDNNANDGLVFNNSVTGTDDFKEGLGHGIMFGFCQNGNSFFNVANNLGLGILCKDATGGGHFNNKISKTGRTNGDGSGIQSKGSTNVKYYANEISMSEASYGAAFVANQDLVTGVNNTGIEVESNLILCYEDVPVTTKLTSTTDANQDVTFKKNSYVNISEMSSAPFAYQGSSYTLSQWKSGVEDDLYESNLSLPIFVESGVPRAVTYIPSQPGVVTSSPFVLQPSQELQVFAVPDLQENEYVTIEVNDVIQGWRSMGVVVNQFDSNGFIQNNKRIAQEYRLTKSATRSSTRIESN